MIISTCFGFSSHLMWFLKKEKVSWLYNSFYDRKYFRCRMPHNSHGLIFYTCSTNLAVLLNNWHTLKTAARARVFFLLFLCFILSYEFKITNSVKVQCRNRGHQIDSNGEKSRALALISSHVVDKPSLSLSTKSPQVYPVACYSLLPLSSSFLCYFQDVLT